MWEHRDYIVGTLIVVALIFSLLGFITGESSCGAGISHSECSDQLHSGRG